MVDRTSDSCDHEWVAVGEPQDGAQICVKCGTPRTLTSNPVVRLEVTVERRNRRDEYYETDVAYPNLPEALAKATISRDRRDALEDGARVTIVAFDTRTSPWTRPAPETPQPASNERLQHWIERHRESALPAIREVIDILNARETPKLASNPCNVPPETDLKTGTVHVCTLGDGTRILCRGDLLILWRDGTQVSMTGKQWIDGVSDETPQPTSNPNTELMHDVCIWLRGALDCKDWVWGVQQWNAADDCERRARESLLATPETPQPAQTPQQIARTALDRTVQEAPATHFAFLWRRAIDPDPWPAIYTDRARAEAAPNRVSDVVPVRLALKASERPHVTNHAGDCKSYCWCHAQNGREPHGR